MSEFDSDQFASWLLILLAFGALLSVGIWAVQVAASK